jgi:hypothetical protein
MTSITIASRTFPVPPGKTAEEYRKFLEQALENGFLESMVEQGILPTLAAPVKPPPTDTDLKKIAAFPGIEQNLLLFQVFLQAFNVRNWSELKERFVRNDQGEVQLNPLANNLANPEELQTAVAAVIGYERVIQRAAPDFAYTDYQFFAVLFTELFFRARGAILERVRALTLYYPMLRLYSETPPETAAELETWLVARLEAVQDKVRTKAAYTKAFEKKLALFQEGVAAGKPVKELLTRYFDLTHRDDYLPCLNRLAFYLATGSGKTHLLHINLLQAEVHLPALLDLGVGHKPNLYLIAPNNELAAQHARELKKYFPRKEIGFVEDGNDKSVTDATLRLLYDRADLRVLTTHQLAEVMKKASEGLFGAANPFGEKNVVFADEGHKGADKDTGWRDDRNRLMGEQGFCFEYSATFSQSIKKKPPLIQEYAKAIIFDFPYRLFYQDGYGKKPVFHPQEQATNIARALLSGKDAAGVAWEVTAEDRWHLFVEQVGRFYQQVQTFNDQKANPEYLRHNFHAPLMLMMGNRVDDKDGASHIREVIELLGRFIANVGDETVNMLACLGHADARGLFGDLFGMVFHAEHQAGLDIRRLNDQELGLKIAGSNRYFGVVYVGTADAVGLVAEPDRLAGSLMEAFFEHGDQPELNIIVAARKLVEGWNTHRISSLGLVELGKTKGSLVVQLFGRGVRLSGTPANRLKRTDRFPVSERFDVFGYDAGYLKTFIDEAEAARIVEERTLEVAICLKDGEPAGRRVPMPRQSFADSGLFVRLASDDRFNRIAEHHPILAEHGQLRFDPRPMLDYRQLYQDVASGLLEPNFLLDWPAFTACADLALKQLALPRTARISDRDFFQRWARGRMLVLLSAWYREQAQEFAFEQAELIELTTENSRNLNFDGYRISGPAEVIEEIERTLMLAGTIKEEAFHQHGRFKAKVARLTSGDKLAVKSLPHLFEPLLVRLENRDDIRISPDRLEPSEFDFVSSLHDYVEANPANDIALLRNQKEWGFLGFYPDFVLWYRKDGIEHIAFIDPKGLTLHNSDDVVEKLGFSLKLGILEERIRSTDPKVRLSSFILLNRPIDDYLSNQNQRDLLKAGFSRLFHKPVADQQLPDLLHGLNARQADTDIEGLLAAIVADGLNKQKEKIKSIVLQEDADAV